MINILIRLLISSLESRTEQMYSSLLLKQNWQQFEEVLDTSDYIKKVVQMIKTRVLDVKGSLNMVYFDLFEKKVAISMSQQFLASVCKIKRCNETSSHQFQLDLGELKSALMSLQQLQPGFGKNKSKTTDSFAAFVNRAIGKVECRIKVLGYPVEEIKKAYEELVDEEQRSPEELTTLLRMRGVNESNQYKNMLGNFMGKL